MSQARKKAVPDAHMTADALGLLREWSKLFTLTASHCTCCGKPLTDALSVTRGIGPDCSAENYNITFEITDEMVMRAMGCLAASHLDSRVKNAVVGLRTRPRDLCNVLVWWSSVHLNDADTVLQCSEIVTLLGFVSLGDRLRERNTDVIVSKDDSGMYVLRCKSRINVVNNMRRIKEAVSVPRVGRFKHGWTFPADRKDLVWTILGEDFGGQWATVPAKDGGTARVVKIESRTCWDVRKMFKQTYNPPTPVAHTTVSQAPAMNTIVRANSMGIEVHTPRRNFDFVGDLKQLPSQDRRWDPTAGCWRVALKHEAKVRALVAQHFNGSL